MKDKLSLVLIGVIATVFLVWYFFPDIILARYKNIEDAGAYGDIFGAVNALFTSLAFALLIYTALMQREELKLQREELQLTRQELAKSAKSQEELVKLSKESNEFQQYIRKREIFPELLIAKAIAASRPRVDVKSEFITKIDLTPAFSELKLKQVKINSQKVLPNTRLNLESFAPLLDRIVGMEERVSIEIFHDQKEALKELAVHILVSDIDEMHQYHQRIVFQNMRALITPSMGFDDFTDLDEIEI